MPTTELPEHVRALSLNDVIAGWVVAVLVVVLTLAVAELIVR